MRAFGFEARSALLIDQPGNRVWKFAVRIAQRLAALGLEKKRPARSEPPEDIVGASAESDQLGVRRTFKVGPAEGERPLEAAILIEDDAGRDQGCPGQMVGEAVG